MSQTKITHHKRIPWSWVARQLATTSWMCETFLIQISVWPYSSTNTIQEDNGKLTASYKYGIAIAKCKQGLLAYGQNKDMNKNHVNRMQYNSLITGPVLGNLHHIILHWEFNINYSSLRPKCKSQHHTFLAYFKCDLILYINCIRILK